MNAIQSFYSSKVSQTRLFVEDRLEMLALKKALTEIGTQNITLSRVEILTHVIFNDLLYVFYPNYTHIYHKKQTEVFACSSKTPPLYVNSSLKEGILFLHRFIASPSSIGSIFPSSAGLIHAMTRKVSEGVNELSPPRKYLDVGAGTGSFTEGIIAKMRPNDTLDIVEYDINLSHLLQRRFQHLSHVHVHNISIFDFHPEEPYDVIVTGLPLNNFSSDTVVQAFKKYADLTKPGGSFCYFEYILFPTIGQVFRKALSYTDSFENAKRIQQAKEEVQNKFLTESDSIYWNITPARAIHCTV